MRNSPSWYVWEAIGWILLITFGVIVPTLLVLWVDDNDFTLLYILLNSLQQ
jgi:hypothetical protein